MLQFLKIIFLGKYRISFELDKKATSPQGECDFQSWTFISKGNASPNFSTYPWKVLKSLTQVVNRNESSVESGAGGSGVGAAVSWV